jgi:hypothetical protein
VASRRLRGQLQATFVSRTLLRATPLTVRSCSTVYPSTSSRESALVSVSYTAEPSQKSTADVLQSAGPEAARAR